MAYDAVMNHQLLLLCCDWSSIFAAVAKMRSLGLQL